MHYKRWSKHGDPLIVLPSGKPCLYLPGTRFGRLVVTGYEPAKRGYRCLCDCGTETVVQVGSLVNGGTRSCGCLAREVGVMRATIHGHARNGTATATYKTWLTMRQRCSNPNNEKWRLYGARGIRVCARWDTSFAAFLADMGERPKGLTIDRIDSDGDYEPGNCRWASTHTQATNRKGIRLTVELAREIRAAVARGENKATLAQRYGVHIETIGDVARHRTWREGA